MIYTENSFNQNNIYKKLKYHPSPRVHLSRVFGYLCKNILTKITGYFN